MARAVSSCFVINSSSKDTDPRGACLAGYVWNQYERRRVSQEEIHQCDMDNQKEARSGKEIFVREIVYGLFAVIVFFALGYFLLGFNSQVHNQLSH
jgi:hypothetical protein